MEGGHVAMLHTKHLVDAEHRLPVVVRHDVMELLSHIVHGNLDG